MVDCCPPHPPVPLVERLRKRVIQSLRMFLIERGGRWADTGVARYLLLKLGQVRGDLSCVVNGRNDMLIK